jgi:hypothetical protein
MPFRRRDTDGRTPDGSEFREYLTGYRLSAHLVGEPAMASLLANIYWIGAEQERACLTGERLKPVLGMA